MTSDGWKCPHCGETFPKPAEGWEDSLRDIHVICPGCDHRTTYPATRRPVDELW